MIHFENNAPHVEAAVAIREIEVSEKKRKGIEAGADEG